jgi:hypothetical protein
MVYVWVVSGVFLVWAIVGLCKAHAGVSRLFEHIEDQRSLAQEKVGVWAGSSTPRYEHAPHQ